MAFGFTTLSVLSLNLPNKFLPQAMQVQFNKREPVQKQATLLFHHETEKNASKKKVQVHQKGARLHKKTCFKPKPVLKNGNLSW